jgi:hypothetical protein
MESVSGRQPRFSQLIPQVRGSLSISQEQMGWLLRASGRSVARWEKQKTGPERGEQRERLEKLQEIVNLGRKIYTAKGLNDFLSTPLSVFGGRTGYEMIFLGEHQNVLSALAADYEGLGT